MKNDAPLAKLFKYVHDKLNGFKTFIGQSEEPMKTDFVQEDGKVHIYTDGSFGRKGFRLGMGATLPHTNFDDETIFFESHERIPNLPVGKQNIAAEIMATTMMLETLPPGHRVKLHTDFQETMFRINHQSLERISHKALAPLWKDLLTAAARHESVKAVFANDKDHARQSPKHKRFMSLTHNAAARASGAKTQKPLSPEDTAKYKGIFEDHSRIHDHHNHGMDEPIETKSTDHPTLGFDRND